VSISSNRPLASSASIPQRGRGAEHGFTLLEIIVAFTILGFALVAALQAFSSGLRNVTAAEGASAAVLHARSKLDEIGTVIPLVPGQPAGVFSDGARWQALIMLYPDPFGRNGASLPLTPYQVSVTVSWGRSQAITLETVKLGVRP
jgi:general secretion pathway protein I